MELVNPFDSKFECYEMLMLKKVKRPFFTCKNENYSQNLYIYLLVSFFSNIYQIQMKESFFLNKFLKSSSQTRFNS
jgi:hypothetical protein